MAVMYKARVVVPVPDVGDGAMIAVVERRERPSLEWRVVFREWCIDREMARRCAQREVSRLLANEKRRG